MGPNSFQWCPATGQGATGTNWSTGHSVWTWGRTSSLWRWRSTGTGCPGRWWSLLLWRYSRPAWTRSCAACCRWPCFGGRVGLDDPQRSLPTPNTLKRKKKRKNSKRILWPFLPCTQMTALTLPSWTIHTPTPTAHNCIFPHDSTSHLYSTARSRAAFLDIKKCASTWKSSTEFTIGYLSIFRNMVLHAKGRFCFIAAVISMWIARQLKLTRAIVFSYQSLFSGLHMVPYSQCSPLFPFCSTHFWHQMDLSSHQLSIPERQESNCYINLQLDVKTCR